MNKVKRAKNLEDILIIETLADEIWKEHYTSIIGIEQVQYMLDKLQSKDAIQAQIQQGYEYYLIYSNESPIGYFSYEVRNTELFLSKLYVLSSARGQGVGSFSMKFMSDQVKQNQLDKISLTVNKYNTNSIKAYEKLGFKIIDSIVQDIGSGYVMDDYVMEKTLFNE